MNPLQVVPVWCWWLLALALVGGGQQLRVIGLQGDLATERSAARDAGEKLAACRETRGNLLVQVGEQNQALAGLRLAAEERQARAAKAVADARKQAEGDYQAANRLQQERTGGDVCAAAEAVIDRELGL
ncbi:hypothetical protein LMK08_16465 [Metapseudomonas furukawaii]|uniref:hypothetical protein n=1 Tax=Metapseudomonas furukawaii TaxID=1149133 RepID=UPI00227D47B1|nr:hypothetical protein [Pseudomonas furukawaii]WAG76968.1 hypothetical protein LMK08_16465 [Pseudomonas furukawaii]